MGHIWSAHICSQSCQIWPIMSNMVIGAHICVRQIWSSRVSLERSCKMQFRRIDLASVGPSSQKLETKLNVWPIAPMWLQCKIKNGCQNVVYGSIMLKIVLVAHLTYENQSGKLHTKVQTFGFTLACSQVFIFKRYRNELWLHCGWQCLGHISFCWGGLRPQGRTMGS